MQEFKQPKKSKRRLFSDDYFLLYIWYSDSKLKIFRKIRGFELTYGRNSKGVIRYEESSNCLSHNELIDDERSDVYAMADVYGSNKGNLDEEVYDLFLERSMDLPYKIRWYVMDMLKFTLE